MLNRIRDAWCNDDDEPFDDPVEVDKTGKRRNTSNGRRTEPGDTGRGPMGKTAVVGVKGRAINEVRTEVVTEAETLRGFFEEDAKVFTDEAKPQNDIERAHEAFKHSVCEYVRGVVHAHGMESLWSLLKRAHKGTFHKVSEATASPFLRVCRKAQHAGLRNFDRMRDTVTRLAGRNLFCRDPVADNGPASDGRSQDGVVVPDQGAGQLLRRCSHQVHPGIKLRAIGHGEGLHGCDSWHYRGDVAWSSRHLSSGSRSKSSFQGDRDLNAIHSAALPSAIILRPENPDSHHAR